MQRTALLLVMLLSVGLSLRALVTSGRRSSPLRLLATVRNMEVETLGDILRDQDVRVKYQIVDVREANELSACALQYDGVVHLPLSTAGEWSEKVKAGELLDSGRPTLCLCKAGIRSMKLANFLITQAGFEEVYNIVGGLDRYADKGYPITTNGSH